MSFSTGFRKCKKCGKTLFGLFDGELCDKCEKAEQEPTSVKHDTFPVKLRINKVSKHISNIDLDELEQEPTYNKLSFPNTFDEFVEQYGITDTDEVYTNGSKLIPAFRVKQWLIEANINGYTQGLKDSSKAEQEPSEIWSIKDVTDAFERHGLIKDQEPCDAVSRQAVLDCFNNKVTLPCDMDTGLLRTYLQAVVDAISKLPPVRPQEQTGHWNLLDECANSGYYCSECQKKLVKEGWSKTVKKIKYCPNCGAKMVEPTCDTCKYNTAAFMPCNACDNKSLFEPQESEEKDDTRWCNTCEFKHLESECLGCAEYDEYDNLINLRNYKKEETK